MCIGLHGIFFFFHIYCSQRKVKGEEKKGGWLPSRKPELAHCLSLGDQLFFQLISCDQLGVQATSSSCAPSAPRIERGIEYGEFSHEVVCGAGSLTRGAVVVVLGSGSAA